jgi:hypothetical protein
MRHVLLLPLLLAPLLLGGCASLTGDASMTNAECRRMANDDPEARAQLARNAGTFRNDLNQPSVDDLKHDAYVRCLRARGLAPKGGVEPVQRNRY